MPLNRWVSTALLLLLCLGASRANPLQTPSPAPAPPVFGDFQKRLKQYLALHNTVPKLRTTRQRREIVTRRETLARKIREARANAKPGDMFGPTGLPEFQRVILDTLRGPTALNARQTIRQGDPVPGWRLTINGDYPEDLPLTTVPPTLLLRLPTLPPQLSYRIIGHDFVLQDTEARIIVDFIPGAIP